MMPYQTIITVTTAGTPVVVTPPAGMPAGGCCKLTFRGLQGNSGSVFVGLASMVKATDVNVLMPLSASGAGVTPDTWSIEDNSGANTIQPANFYLDANTSGDKVVVIFQQR